MPLALEPLHEDHNEVARDVIGPSINGMAKHVVDPQVLAKPNIALWVTKDHK